jgi:predicted N-formylglutamate amidohydrolase
MPARAAKPIQLVLTCEHGGADIPRRYAALFGSREARAALETHRGSDLGALAVARKLARSLEAPLVYTTISRLLIDANRSEHHPRALSEWSRALAPLERQSLIAMHRTHRASVRQTIAQRLGTGARVLHVAVHSFTPVLDGEARNADIGLLYDPSRPLEATLCRKWQALLGEAVRVRRNYPYRGTTDGLTTALRRSFPSSRYAGVELELGQGLLLRSRAAEAEVTRLVVRTLGELLRL